MIKRQIRIEGGSAFIPLTKGYFAVIDSADVALVEGFNWYAHKVKNTVYAMRKVYHPHNQSQTGLYLHRAITNAPDEMEVDHKSGDGLDNRRSNLRIVTHAQNIWNQRKCSRNTSGYRGVCKADGKWGARIMIGGKRFNLGRFNTVDEARSAYNKAAESHYGEFSKTIEARAVL